MSHLLIRAGYEPARPKLVLLAIALVILAVQLVSTPLGFSKPLFLVEVAGIFVCIITGFLVYLVGMEIGEIAIGNSVGGGLGALAGWVLGYLYCDHTLAVVACIVGGGGTWAGDSLHCPPSHETTCLTAGTHRRVRC